MRISSNKTYIMSKTINEGVLIALKSQIEQGTVIYGIKSQKYPSFPCYGVIITARCDIAQGKVPKYYYLEAVDATSWFCSKYGYQQVYSAVIKDKRTRIYNAAQELELDGITLLSKSPTEIQAILDDKKQQLSSARSLQKKVDTLAKCIDEYVQIAQIDSDDIHRKQAIKTNSKAAITYIKDLDSGKFHHYHFIPQAAYLDNTIKSNGLIVDFLEIRSLSLEDAKKIAVPLSSNNHNQSGIHYSDLPALIPIENIVNKKELDNYIKNLTEYSRLKANYWLEHENDFVAIDGTIKSPWCEHLMQRFSNCFSRIGLDNPTDNDYKELIENCYKE